MCGMTHLLDSKYRWNTNHIIIINITFCLFLWDILIAFYSNWNHNQPISA